MVMRRTIYRPINRRERTYLASLALAILLGLLVIASAPGCASTNVRMERLVRDAIQTSEDMRCSVRRAPCLSESQFRAVNAELYKAAVVGGEVTKLARAGQVTPTDYRRLWVTATNAITVLAAEVFPAGTIGDILAKLSQLSQRAQALAGVS